MLRGTQVSWTFSVLQLPGSSSTPGSTNPRRLAFGDGQDRWRLEQALHDSEDSAKLNTSFVERLNLTIRQGSAYHSRRTICQARWKQRLEDHLELVRRHYNFVRASPGAEIWTGSQNTSQAGWVDQADADVKGNLLIEAAFYGVEESQASRGEWNETIR